jgi:hypothetical protein
MAPMSTYVIEVNVNRLGSDITAVDLADPVPEEMPTGPRSAT